MNKKEQESNNKLKQGMSGHSEFRLKTGIKKDERP